MSEEKKAFVFDTNFIITVKDLQEVVSNICDKFDIYVTEVSINERISQQCYEEKKKYDEIRIMSKKCAGIIGKLNIKKQEIRLEELKNGIQSNYDTLFGEHIIPLDNDEGVFSDVLNRAYNKIPPFSTAENASDKGFKDTLIWLSVLAYFKLNGNKYIIFVTDDKGFINNAEILCEEFRDITGKEIEIKSSAYYKNLLVKETKEEVIEKTPLPDVSELRPKIHQLIQGLCYTETYNQWGTYYVKIFDLTKKVDAEYMKIIFESLEDDIRKHIFDEYIPADTLFGLDNRVINGECGVPIFALENVLSLYQDIQHDYPDFIEQFYNTAANIFNQNYVESKENYDEDDLPF